ncbi:tetratricopeptide repeat protein 12 [Drosophila subpulchrella]|uniref:tetratricopeptide repeat protein 12 n=1 Tax=Drosophila subpulchrella TaxID=1486046 RepID=UPI0018A1992B|nr:tetratricopeptide repeat protein 12 [Drosophila subpulchrella]
MYSLQHPQIDERFLDSESTVEEVVKLLENLQVPKDDEDDQQDKVEKDTKPSIVTEENFIITARTNATPVISATKDTASRDKSKPRTFSRLDRSKDRYPFMRQVEMDLDQRSKARLERERVAQNFRKLGNAEYRKGDYESAMQMYTEAIENIRDSHILYINRALCFIKSGKFKRGIVDCDFVLNKLDEKNLRAWMYRAMAYKGLNDESNFENCVKYARKFNSKQMEFIDDFLEKLK